MEASTCVVGREVKAVKTDDEAHSCQEHCPAVGRVLDDKTMLCFTLQTLSIAGLMKDGLSES